MAYTFDGEHGYTYILIRVAELQALELACRDAQKHS